jgi:hypothetical protein
MRDVTSSYDQQSIYGGQRRAPDKFPYRNFRRSAAPEVCKSLISGWFDGSYRATKVALQHPFRGDRMKARRALAVRYAAAQGRGALR